MPFAKLFGIFRQEQDQEIVGTIEELTVERLEEGERWVFRLDGSPGLFAYEPSPLSPPRRAGQRVRIGFKPGAGADGRQEVEWLFAA